VREVRKEGPSVVKKAEEPIRRKLAKRHKPNTARKGDKPMRGKKSKKK
jgi:hypothetical protein